MNNTPGKSPSDDALDAGTPAVDDTPDAAPSLPAGILTTEIKSPVVEKILNHLGADNVAPAHIAELGRILATIDLTAETENIEQNTQVLALVINQLELWGYQPTENHRKSLKAKTIVDKLRDVINEYVTVTKLSDIKGMNYVSNVGLYNVATTILGDRISYVKTIPNRRMDRFENILRVSGDRGGNIITGLFKSSVREKASIEQIAKNIQELGLDPHFTIAKDGNEVKSINENIEDIRQGAILDDLLRLQDESDFLKKLDPKIALELTAKMLDDLHRSSGRGVGEVLANDIVLQIENGQVKGVRLTLPDVAFNEGIEAIEQKATDLLDLCFSVGTAAFQKGGVENGEAIATTNITALLSGYTDANVKTKMKELMESGRPFLTMHNTARLGYDRDEDTQQADRQIRDIIRNLS